MYKAPKICQRVKARRMFLLRKQFLFAFLLPLHLHYMQQTQLNDYIIIIIIIIIDAVRSSPRSRNYKTGGICR